MKETSYKKIIISIGDPIIDILAKIDKDCLSKYNLELGRSTLKTKDNEAMYDFMECQADVTYIPGGSVTNSMRVANVLKF
jgi:hypothetical protein